MELWISGSSYFKTFFNQLYLKSDLIEQVTLDRQYYE